MPDMKRHQARFSAGTWSRIAQIAERLSVSIGCVMRALVEHALLTAERPSSADDGLYTLDEQIITATAEPGRKRQRYLQNAVIAELLNAAQAFDAEATEASGDDWRRFALGLRSFAVRVERQSHLRDEARQHQRRVAEEVES